MFDIESYLSGEFARAFGIKEEEAFCVGNGTKKPTGLFTANGGQVGVTAAGTTAITADELINRWSGTAVFVKENGKLIKIK
jgi:HK97 family phage major capsid protein